MSGVSAAKIKDFFEVLTIERLQTLMFVSMSVLVVLILMGHELLLARHESLSYSGLSIDLFFALIIVVNLFLYRRKIYSSSVANRIAVAAFFAVQLLLFYEGALRYFEGSAAAIGAFWIVLLPIPTFLLLGNKEGSAWTLLFIASILPPLLVPEAAIFENINQPSTQIVYIIIGMLVVSGWFYFHQRMVDQYVRDIAKHKREYRRLSTVDEVTINSIGQAVLVTDADGLVVEINSHALELLKIKRSDIVKKTLSDVFEFCNEKYWAIEPDDLPVRVSMRTNKQNEQKLNFVLADGRLITVVFSASPLEFEDEVIGAVVTFVDISEEVERDRARASFLQLATHELRTPLSTIRWYLEYVLDDARKLTKSQKDSIQEAHHASTRMAALIDELLKISQLDAGLFAVDAETVNIKKIVQEVISDEAVSIKVNKMDVRVVCTGDYKQLKQDPNLIRILVLNFLTNAIKYSPPGSRIDVRVEVGKKLKIAVKDRGIGVPPKQRIKMFTKQFRADNAIQLIPEGNGLGLHLSKRIATLLNGRIGFESTEGKGSTFWVVLPKTTKTLKGISEQEKSKAAIV